MTNGQKTKRKVTKRKNKKIVRPTNYIPLYNLPLRIGSVSRSDGQTKIYIMEDFNLFWDLFNPDPEFANRNRATYSLWLQKSDKTKKAVIEWLKSKDKRPTTRNPYFFLLDFREPRQQTLTFKEYYARYGTTLEQDGWRMTNPAGQQVIYVKN